MRRFIAYTTLAATMLVTVAVSATPVLTLVNPGNEFVAGREVSFKITEKDGNSLTYDGVKGIAKDMSDRLANLQIEDYSVKIQNVGNNSANDAVSQYITVSMSCDEALFNNACKYLSFSGEDFQFSTTKELSFKSDVINYSEAYIAQYRDVAPFVVIPLTDDGTKIIDDYIADLNASSEDESTTKSIKRTLKVGAHDDEGNPLPGEETENSDEEGTAADIFIWGNHDDSGLEFNNVENFDTANSDPRIANKIIMAFASSDIYFTPEDASNCGIAGYKEKTAIKYYCQGSTIQEANTDAYLKLGMLKASKYKYNVECPTVSITQSGYDYFDNAVKVRASAESLLSYNERNVTLNFGFVMVAFVLIIVIISATLGVYFRLPAIGMVATTISTLFLSLLVSVGLGTLINIPALLGILLVSLESLFTEIFYVTKMKEEILKGRNFKKANQEASKKSNLITLDTAVVSMISGLMMYLLGGVALKPMGTMLFFGGAIALAMNLIVFKFLMYLLTNTTAIQDNFELFNIKEKNVPNIMLEQKPSYVAPFEKVEFTKPKKVASIAFAALAGLSLFSVLLFGIKDSSPLNVERATQDTAVIYTSFEKKDSIAVNDVTTFKMNILKDITDNGEEIDINNIHLSEVSKFNPDHIDQPDVSYYFTVELKNKLSDKDLSDMLVNITANLEAQNITESVYNASVNILNSRQIVYAPDQGLVALATGISILCVSVYFIFRFGPSRGLASMVITTGSSLTSYGLASLVRIGTSAITSLAMPIVAFSGIFGSLMFFIIEKSMLKENHDSLTPEMRNEIMKKALGKVALPYLTFNAAMVFTTIYLFGLGLPVTCVLFGASLIGELIATAGCVILLGPLSVKLSETFAKINLPKLRKDSKQSFVSSKPKTSEPEETIFIGIND